MVRGSLEFELERELEIPLRIGAEIGRRIDRARAAARIESATAEAADKSIGIAQVDVVEEVHGFDAEFQMLRFRDDEFLEQRRVRTPIVRAAQAVAFLVAERAHRWRAEYAQVIEELKGAIGLS